MKKKDAIDYFGSARALAEALGISRQAVYQWPDTVPDTQMYKLAWLTDGALAVEDSDDDRK